MRNFFPPHNLRLRYLSPKSPFSERGLTFDLKVSNFIKIRNSLIDGIGILPPPARGRGPRSGRGPMESTGCPTVSR